NQKPLVGVTDFVTRQTKDSPYSHYEPEQPYLEPWPALAGLVTYHMAEGHVSPGYRDGVVLVHVPPAGFWCGVVDLAARDCPKLIAVFAARRDGEDPFVSVYADSPKQPAKGVDVVGYAADLINEPGQLYYA